MWKPLNVITGIWDCEKNYNHIKLMITITMITLTGFYFIYRQSNGDLPLLKAGQNLKQKSLEG